MKKISLGIQTRAAAVAPASINNDARTVELVWSTGAAVRRADWVTGRAYVEELSMESGHVRLERLNQGAPLLSSHNRYSLDSVLGVVEKAWLSDGEGRAVVRFSTRSEVDPVWQDVRDGIIRNVSVGYKVHRFVEMPAAADKVPTFRAVDWEPEEISLVTIGADADAGIRGSEERGLGPCEIETKDSDTGQTLQMARCRLALAERE